MRSKAIITIPKPCHESWDKMSPTEKGRHCSSCQKEVVDFSTWEHEDVVNYLDSTIGETCGRFRNEQLESTQPRLIDLLPSAAKNFGRAAAIAAIAFFHSDALQAQEIASDSLPIVPTETAYNQKSTIVKGLVNDSKGHPLSFANVTYETPDGTIKGALTDRNGRFEVEVSAQDAPHAEIDLRVRFIGYEEMVVRGLRLNNEVVSMQMNMKESDLLLVEQVLPAKRRLSIKTPVKSLIHQLGLTGKNEKKQETEEEEPVLLPADTQHSESRIKAQDDAVGDSLKMLQPTENAAEIDISDIELPAWTIDLKQVVIRAKSETQGSTVYQTSGLVSMSRKGAAVVVQQSSSVHSGDVEKTQAEEGVELTLFPNPTADVLNIKIDVQSNAPFYISDVSGKRITMGQLEGGLAKFDTSHLARGTYMLVVENGTDDPLLRRFVVER